MTDGCRPEDLLREMRTAVVPVEHAERLETRRNSTVTRLRELQILATTRREVEMSIRKRVLVASLVLLSSAGALAATARVWDSSFKKATAPRVSSVVGEVGLRTATNDVPSNAAKMPGAKNAISVLGPPLLTEKRRDGLGVRSRAGTKKSTLAAENTLMQDALVEASSGRDGRAVALLDDLIARYPDSPLRQNAEVERFRALERLGDIRQATSEARRYLGEHPNGMAEDEARRLAVPPAQGAPLR